MVAALYVEKDGCYFGQKSHIDPWDESRDARLYAGPWPVVAHPPCQRWGRFWHGSTRKPHQFKLGDDGGCFEAALPAVRRYGGVLEHPADSRAWAAFNLNPPPREGGWVAADMLGGWTCCVSQGYYGHMADKRTWLYACHTATPEMTWGDCEQRLHPVALAKYGYEKARRIGMVAMVGGKRKTEIRNATPPPFREVLLMIARTATHSNRLGSKEFPNPALTAALHRGTDMFAIEYIGHVLPQKFISPAEAETWALWNYKGSRRGWKVVGSDTRNAKRRRTAADRAQIVENRALIRKAFDIIRHDPARQRLVARFAHALGGSQPTTEELLLIARGITAGLIG